MLMDARLQSNPVLGGRGTLFSVFLMFLCFWISNSLPEGKAFDTVVVARWLRFVVNRGPIDGNCVSCWIFAFDLHFVLPLLGLF